KRLKVLRLKVDARTPEYLLVVFPGRRRIGIVRSDAPDARADREGDRNLLVDGSFVAAGAQAAMIIIRPQRFQRGVGAEHAAAPGGPHLPRKVDQPEPGGVQKARDHLFFVEPGPFRKIK